MNLSRLYIEADKLQRALQAELIRSYRRTGDSAQTFKIDRILDRAEHRKARRHQALRLETINRATRKNDAFTKMMESYREGQRV